MASAVAQIPPALRPIAPYIRIASQHEAKNPVIAYWCRFFALDTGLKMNKDGAERSYLITLMDTLEKMKKDHKEDEAFTNDIVAQSHIENHALRLFNWADQQDRASNFDKAVIQAFHAAGYILDILANFGEMSEEHSRMSRYAKWKATYIHKCLKEGKQPIPGPLKGDDEGFEEDAAGASGTPTQQPAGGDGTPQEPNSPPIPMPRNTLPDNDFGLPEPPKPKDESLGAYPKTPSMPQYPQAPATPSQPMYPPVAPVPSEVPNSSVAVTTDQILKAQKYCKYANSALTYEDVQTAVLNLQKALTLLTTGTELP